VSLLFSLFLSPVKAWADCWPEASQSATIAALEADGSLLLSDGQRLRLAGIERPQTDEVREAWRMLIDEVGGRAVSLRLGSAPLDRYGHVQAMVLLPDQNLLQARLVREGLTRVMPIADQRACLSQLLAMEDEARQARRGIWSDARFAPIEANQIEALLAVAGRYALVEGEVVEVANRRGRLYVNFADDWRTDFTVTVAPAEARLLIAELLGGEPERLSEFVGRRLRVRGYLTRYNGPEIIVTSPDQIEVLGSGANDKGD
jgi:endonuclease YncB( thermonuclease family)